MLFDTTQIPELMSWFTSKEDVVFWAGMKFSYPFTLASFAEQLKLRDILAFALVCQDTGQLLGFGQLMADIKRCHLVRIAIHPKYRRRGLGQILVQSLCLQGQQLFAPESFSLFVNKANSSALALYKSLGFKVDNYRGEMPTPQSWYMTRTLK